MTNEEYLDLVFKTPWLDPEHEDYLKSRGADLQHVREWGVTTFVSPSVLCPNLKWAKSYGSNLDFFEGSLVCPIRSTRGNLIGMEWRKGDIKKKLFVREDEYRPLWLGLPFEMRGIWEQRKICLCEGLSSSLALKRTVKLPVLASGTANLSEVQIEFLERFVDVVYVVFDMDKAGNMGFEVAKKKIKRRDLKFEKWVYGKQGDDPAKVWDRGGIRLLEENFGELQ